MLLLPHGSEELHPPHQALGTMHGSPGHGCLGVRTSPVPVSHGYMIFNRGEAKG